MTLKSSGLRYIFLFILSIIMLPERASALPVETYAANSVLAQGRWVKVAVSETGVHFIPASTLRSWGFADPSKVRVHGYGGNRQPSRLTVANFSDDLPEVAACRTAAGIYFYGVGPVEWQMFGRTNYLQSLNPYTTEGFYFLTQGSEEPLSVKVEAGAASDDDPQTEFREALFHEIDNATVSHSGANLYGEDLRYTRSRSFRFDLTDIVEGSSAWLRCTSVYSSIGNVKFEYSVNGEKLSSQTGTAPDLTLAYGKKIVSNNTFTPNSAVINFQVSLSSSGTVSEAYLDAITVNYDRKIRLDGGKLNFRAGKTKVALDGADASTHVWDVTKARIPVEMETEAVGAGVEWVNPYTGSRNYVAWNESATFPVPKYVSSVDNQNLHGITKLPDMVIFTVRDWAGEAERVAALHRRAPDNMEVLVVVQDEVFNEFSSGARDPEGFRRMLKMLYDRGKEASRPPQYVLFFGRPNFDNRCLTSQMKNYNVPFMPVWQSEESLSTGASLTSDDYFVQLEDNTGSSMGNDRLSMAVGRIPCHSLSQARDYVDKLYEYADNRLKSQWKNSVVLEGDNGNSALFVNGLEAFYDTLTGSADGSSFVYTKVYYDAFPIQSGVCAAGRERFYRALDDGVMFWIYNGHGALETLGAEGIHTRSDIENTYNERWPVLFASTCDFGRWDGVDRSGMEKLLFNRSGGIISGIGATRKSYIADNDVFVRVLGNHFLRRDENGEFKRLGDMVRESKNALTGSASTTKNSYALMGDPAMRMGIPSATIVLDSIGTEEVKPEAQVTVMARQRVRFSGSLYDARGVMMSDFNGDMSLTMYDAEYSTTSNGLPASDDSAAAGVAVTFEEKGGILYVGRTRVVNGRFSIEISMPSEVADNFRPATLNMYAHDDFGREAMGVSRDFYVYGYDTEAEPDDQAPVIDYAYLNHSSFVNGDIVNEQPMFIAGVSDDVAINLSMAGIGHQMTLKLDDRRTYNDVSLYYTPASDGSASGTIAYPMSELEAGNHTLAFRVWDTSGNSATHTFSFFVEPGAAPKLFDIFTDVNPATDHANFYLSHNRPDANATVELDIYSISGRHVWSSKVTGRSDMFLSTPIQWNLTDFGGRRVPRGIYIYRAVLNIDGYEMQSQAKRIAVTGH